MISFIDKLNKQSVLACEQAIEFLGSCSVYYKNPNNRNSGVHFVNPTVYHWGEFKLNDSGRKQIVALRSAKEFFEK